MCSSVCDPCARVSTCELVPCVRCVPAVPQVSFYRNFKNTGGSRTDNHESHEPPQNQPLETNPFDRLTRQGVGLTVLYCTVPVLILLLIRHRSIL